MIQNKTEIISFSEGLEEPIKTLNYEWLEKYFHLEESDIRSLSNPKAEIIDKDGFIFYAKLNDEIVGTCSLLKKDANIFELEKWQFVKKHRDIKLEHYCWNTV